MSHRVRIGLALVLTTVWALNFLASLMVPEYHPDVASSAAFLAAMGALMAVTPDRAASVASWTASRGNVLRRYLTADDRGWLRSHGWLEEDDDAGN